MVSHAVRLTEKLYVVDKPGENTCNFHLCRINRCRNIIKIQDSVKDDLYHIRGLDL